MKLTIHKDIDTAIKKFSKVSSLMLMLDDLVDDFPTVEKVSEGTLGAEHYKITSTHIDSDLIEYSVVSKDIENKVLILRRIAGKSVQQFTFRLRPKNANSCILTVREVKNTGLNWDAIWMTLFIILYYLTYIAAATLILVFVSFNGGILVGFIIGCFISNIFIFIYSQRPCHKPDHEDEAKERHLNLKSKRVIKNVKTFFEDRNDVNGTVA